MISNSTESLGHEVKKTISKMTRKTKKNMIVPENRIMDC